MPRPPLPHEPPAWTADYLPVAFQEHGRSRAGADCWGLTRLVYAERRAIDLPSFEDGYASTDASGEIDSLVAGELWRGRWAPAEIPDARLYDVALYRIKGERAHVGVVVSRDHILHTRREVGPSVERMSSIPWSTRLAGLYRYQGAGVRLTGRPRLFDPSRIDRVAAEGQSIEEILAEAGVYAHEGVHVHIGSVRIPRERWGHVRPKAGRTVRVSVAPLGGGGGSKALRIVLIIAIVILSVYTAGATAPLLGPAASAGLGAAISIGGSLLVNALVPIPKARLSEQGPDRAISPTITGTRNEARPYGVVPVVLGRHRLAPLYGAQVYTEQSGDDQYLRLLFLVGYGPLYLRDLKIGQTPIEQFRGAEIQLHRGYINNRKLSLYPGTVHEEGLSILMTNAGGWYQRTTQIDTEEVSVDFAFPSGLVWIDRDGSRRSATIEIRVEYRPTGSGSGGWVGVQAGSPTLPLGMDMLSREPQVRLGGTAIHTGRISWSAGANLGDPKPSYLPANNYCWVAEGFVYIPDSWSYEFALDSTDASDLYIDDDLVSSWYGSHPHAGSGGVPDYSQSTIVATKTYTPGWHAFRVRVERRTNSGGGVAVGYRRRISLSQYPPFLTIPATSFSTSQATDPTAVGKLNVRWYDFSGYGSDLFVTSSQPNAVRRTLTWAVPRGQYDVRVKRVTADIADTSDATLIDDLFWSGIRSINFDEPIRLKGMARIAMRIKATDQLNGVIDTFNLVARSVLPDFDTNTNLWVERATNNPAAHYRAVLQGPANKRPLPDSRIDIPALEAWHDECRVNAWEFNGVFDTAGTIAERLADICAAGRAVRGTRDGKHTVIRDRAQSAPVQHFTPRNSRGFKMRQVFPDRPQGLKVRFLNELNGWQQDERLVPTDGFGVTGHDGIRRNAFGVLTTDPEATLFETIELLGVTHPTQIWKHARYWLAVAKLRPRSFELSTDVEHLACTRGDLVRVSSDVAGFGLGSGRLTAVQVSANAIQSIDLDSAVGMETGKSYAVRVRSQDGRAWIANVNTVAGEAWSLTVTTPPVVADPHPMAGDLFMFGEVESATRSMLVRGISMGEDLSATLDLVDSAPAVLTADTGVIPDFVSGVGSTPSIERGPEAPVVTAIRSDEYVMRRNPDGSLSPRMVLTLAASSGTRPTPAYAIVRTRPFGSGAAWTQHPQVPLSGLTVAVDDVEQGVAYFVAVEVITAIGEVSLWTSTWDPDGTGTVDILHTIVGQTMAPPDADGISVYELGDARRQINFDLGMQPPDTVGGMLRYGTVGQVWSAMTPINTSPAASTPLLVRVPAPGTYDFAVKAIDMAGNVSANEARVAKTLVGDPSMVARRAERAGGWAGTKTRGGVSGGDLVANAFPAWDDITTWDAFLSWDQAAIMVYETAALDGGMVFDLIPDVTAAGTGSIVLEVAWSTDGSTWSSWTAVAAARASTHNAQYVKARATVSPTSGDHTPLLTELTVLIRNPA